MSDKTAYLLEIFELLVAGKSLFLAHPPMDGDRGEVLLDQKLRQSHASLHGFDEDDHLIELQHVQELKQLPVLLRVLQFHVMLAQSVKSQLRFVVNVDFHGLEKKKTRVSEIKTSID